MIKWRREKTHVNKIRGEKGDTAQIPKKPTESLESDLKTFTQVN
jgi:hypothetical protein